MGARQPYLHRSRVCRKRPHAIPQYQGRSRCCVSLRQRQMERSTKAQEKQWQVDKAEAGSSLIPSSESKALRRQLWKTHSPGWTWRSLPQSAPQGSARRRHRFQRCNRSRTQHQNPAPTATLKGANNARNTQPQEGTLDARTPQIQRRHTPRPAPAQRHPPSTRTRRNPPVAQGERKLNTEEQFQC